MAGICAEIALGGCGILHLGGCGAQPQHHAARARLKNLHMASSPLDGSTTGTFVPISTPAVSACENSVIAL